MTNRNKLQQYPTAEIAWLKITALQRKLGLPETPEAQMEPYMDSYLAAIDSLEDQLFGDSTRSTVAAVTPAKQPSVKVDLTKTAPAESDSPLFGVARAAAAQREGRTSKPTLTASTALLTGVMRSAAAQEKLNSRKS